MSLEEPERDLPLEWAWNAWLIFLFTEGDLTPGSSFQMTYPTPSGEPDPEGSKSCCRVSARGLSCVELRSSVGSVNLQELENRDTSFGNFSRQL